jgi:hypothetical protein
VSPTSTVPGGRSVSDRTQTITSPTLQKPLKIPNLDLEGKRSTVPESVIGSNLSILILVRLKGFPFLSVGNNSSSRFRSDISEARLISVWGKVAKGSWEDNPQAASTAATTIRKES